MAEDDDGLLTRWSRRKQEAAEPPAAISPPAAAAGDRRQALSEEERRAVIERLPDIESLDASSDFTAFMQDGVPEMLRRRALRKLWRLNPLYARLDGLNDYDEDFTDAATVVANLKTLYQVGKGMVEDPAAPSESPPVTATAPAQPDANPDDEAAPNQEAAREDEARAAEPPPSVAAPSPPPPAPARTGRASDGETATSRIPKDTGRSAVARRWGGYRG